MEGLAFLLVLLVCPVVMGVMMFFTMRGMRRGASRDRQDE